MDKTPLQLVDIILSGHQYTEQEKELARIAKRLLDDGIGVTQEQIDVLSKSVKRLKPVIEPWEIENWTVDTWNS